MDAHRIEVLDRADDDHVVLAVAHDLELELVPAEKGFLDQHLSDGALAQRPVQHGTQLGLGVRGAAAVAAERERRPEDDREGQPLRDLIQRRDDRRLGHFEPRRADGFAEELAVLGPLDHVQARADQLDAERGQDAGLGQLHRQIERRLAAHRRQERVRPLALEHGGDAFEVERLEVRAVGETGVGHDRRRVRVDDDGGEAVLAQHLERLRAGVVELAGLPDDDRTGADQADRVEIRPPWQGRSPP